MGGTIQSGPEFHLPVHNISDTFTLIQTTGNILGQFAQGDHVSAGGKVWFIVYSRAFGALRLQSDLAISMTGPSSLAGGH